MCIRDSTDQKGLDLINYVIDRLVDDFTQIVVIGTGDPQYENMFRHYADVYKRQVPDGTIKE